MPASSTRSRGCSRRSSPSPRTKRGSSPASAASVHLETFPEADPALRDTALEAQVEQLLKLRGVIAQAIEPARQAKEIGNALEGAVALQIADAALFDELQGPRARNSRNSSSSATSPSSRATKRARASSAPRTRKCARCWRHRESVGAERRASRALRSLRRASWAKLSLRTDVYRFNRW